MNQFVNECAFITYKIFFFSTIFVILITKNYQNNPEQDQIQNWENDCTMYQHVECLPGQRKVLHIISVSWPALLFVPDFMLLHPSPTSVLIMTPALLCPRCGCDPFVTVSSALISRFYVYLSAVSQAFMVDVASQARDADFSGAPGLTLSSGFQGSLHIHHGAVVWATMTMHHFDLLYFTL